jgi:hypothetical protein
MVDQTPRVVTTDPVTAATLTNQGLPPLVTTNPVVTTDPSPTQTLAGINEQRRILEEGKAAKEKEDKEKQQRESAREEGRLEGQKQVVDTMASVSK